MDVRTVFEMGVGVAALLGIVWATAKWIFGPHLRETIQETVTGTVGDQLAEVPKLTTAVTELTGAIREQNRDNARLTTSLEEVRDEVHGLRADLSGLAERTAALEGAESARDQTPPRRRRRPA